MIFLGTGAAELIPDPFCECEVCRHARFSKDTREKRLRSALYLDANNLIDIGPDVPSACARYGLSLSTLRNLFITHFHSDHFAVSSLETLRMSVTERPKLRLFGSPEGIAGALSAHIQDAAHIDISLEAIAPGERRAVDDFFITPLRTIHSGAYPGETAQSYLFERGGKAFLYACDTGLYPEENDKTLKGRALDLVIMEGTFGDGAYPLTSKHMTCASLAVMMERLAELKAITQDTRIVLTHIAHKGLLTHEQYTRRAHYLFGDRACVAYDGMVIDDDSLTPIAS